jgi:hypothetical protein
MNESITIVIELPELRSRIKAEDSEARNIAKKSLAHVIECGRLLIELKSRVNHGHWKYEARQLNMSARTISNYMRIAANRQQVAVLGEGVRDALELLSIAKSPPPAQVEPPAPETQSPPPSRSALIEVEAEIVAHAQKVETPDEMFQRGLDSLQETMPREEFIELLETALAKSPEAERVEEPPAPAVAPATAPLETEVEEPPAAPVRLKTTSPASPSQSAAILVFEIYKLLPKMSEEDLKGASASLTELVGVIESRWMKTTSTAPATLSEAWSKTSPEDRAAFLETAHLINRP